MDSKVVNRFIRAEIRPLLREQGFDISTARTFWRRWREGIDVINFQSFNSYLADGVGCTSYSFSINVAILLDYVDHAAVIKADRPPEYHCDLRKVLEKGIAQPFFHPYKSVWHLIPGRERRLTERPDVWYVLEDGSNLEECMVDARQQLIEVGLPWLDAMHDPAHVLEQSLHPDLRVRSPALSPKLLHGYALIRLGRREEGLARLAEEREREREWREKLER